VSSHLFTAANLRRLIVSKYDPNAGVCGIRYARGGMVDEVVAEPFESGWSVEAKVKGSARKPYIVEVLLLPGTDGDLDLDQFCSCPVGEFCKHGVALIEMLAMQPDRWLIGGKAGDTRPPPPARPGAEGGPWTPGGQRQSAPPPREPIPAPTLKPALSDWISRLSRSITADGNAVALKKSGANKFTFEERILYLLNPMQRHLSIQALAARRLKSGGLGVARHVPWSGLIGPNRRQGSTDEDGRLAREIALEQVTLNAWQYYLEGESGAVLLGRLVATGRCYWRKTGRESTPLRLGQARQAVPGWELQSDGAQQPRFQILPPVTALLPLIPLWYVDEPSNECGPIETSLTPMAAITWLEAPVVDAEEAELVQVALTPEADRVELPLPTAMQVKWAEDVKPIPVLTLYGATVPRFGRDFLWESPKKNMPMGLGRLMFRYGTVEVPCSQTAGTVQERTEAGLIRYRRDRALETREASLLRLNGLLPANETRLERQWGQESNSYIALQDSDWMPFMDTTVPELRERGWEIVIEPSFPWRVAEAESWFIDAEDVGRDRDGPQEDWFGVELGAVVDGQRINLLPVLLALLAVDPSVLSPERLAEGDGAAGIPLQLPDGRILMFPADRARTLHQLLFDLFKPGALDGEGKLRVPRLRAAELAGEADWRWLGGKELQDLAVRLRDFQGIRAVTLPAGLKADLRPYQQEGLNWLQFLREHDFGGILADDMGLGKTVQALAHLMVEKESGRADRPSLVVAPTSLMTNWRQEAERFAPGLRVLVLHGMDRRDHFDQIREHDLILTTYPLLPRDGPLLRKHPFHCLILDEAQFIKNPRTAAAQAVAGLEARHRLCLTGTPMENHLGELWSLFHFLMPGFLGDSVAFRRVFRVPIEKLGDASRRAILGRRVKPFLLRRRKEEVARELPAKNEIVQHVELTGVQRDLYESVRLAMHERVQQEVKKKGFSRAHIVILDALLKLRQICCHPALLKLPSAQAVQESAKLDLLFELLPPMLEEGRRVLLFSQFTSMLALIEEELRRRHLPYVLLTGDTTDRATPVQRFQSGEVPLFLISLKAGGTGLNLTAADTVIHYDPWWNPAVENQATDRAHRIGQEKQVFVYRLLTLGTVEEKIAALQARKRELVKGLLDEGAGGKLELTHEDLESLFAPVE